MSSGFTKRASTSVGCTPARLQQPAASQRDAHAGADAHERHLGALLEHLGTPTGSGFSTRGSTNGAAMPRG